MVRFANILNIIHGIAAFFISVLGVRVMWPVLNVIFDMQESGVVKAVMYLITWLILFFVIYITTYHFMFEPQETSEVKPL